MFILTLLATVFLFSVNTIFAISLEVKYPTIAGQTITQDTKLPAYASYLFNAGMFIGFFAVFLSITIAGVMYVLHPAKADFLADAKERIMGAISGLLILVLTYLIVTTINPALSIFKLDELSNSTPPPAPQARAEGVYFYQNSGCPENSNDAFFPYTSNRLDLGVHRKKVNSVGIVQGNNSYIAILYENLDLWGKCHYVDPNSSCTSVTPFAQSVSIHAYEFDPNGEGVTFYRKSFFDTSGGYYEVKNNSIKGIFEEKLSDLKFEKVPEEEQDCVGYDDNGACAERSVPTLAGENISSVKIKGDYVVLFTYAGPGKDCSDMILDYCQEFPTADDVNKIGPPQIKWEDIRNYRGVIPNCVTIIPVKSS